MSYSCPTENKINNLQLKIGSMLKWWSYAPMHTPRHIKGHSQTETFWSQKMCRWSQMLAQEFSRIKITAGNLANCADPWQLSLVRDSLIKDWTRANLLGPSLSVVTLFSKVYRPPFLLLSWSQRTLQVVTESRREMTSSNTIACNKGSHFFLWNMPEIFSYKYHFHVSKKASVTILNLWVLPPCPKT